MREHFLKTESVSKPEIVLPSGQVTISECAQALFTLIAPTSTLFVRGNFVSTLETRNDGTLCLEILRGAAARSRFEKFGLLRVWRKGENNVAMLKPTTCPQEMAEALLASVEAKTILPRVEGLINCPIIREHEGVLKIVPRGYDPETKLIVTGGDKPPEVKLQLAVERLLSLLDEFDFQTPGDKSRAIASFISPALKVGGFIRGRVPADVAEADQSQSGKTYRQKMIAAIYNETVSIVTSRQGGVGSMDETFNHHLIGGRPFIQFDNMRGHFSSPHLEAFLTAEGLFSCRVPHREVSVQPDRFFVFLSSNGVDTTRDFANRSCIIRIRKKSPGFAFKEYAEGDLLAHVKQHQSFYLGCIFAVIREWFRHGKPKTSETRHDFREWVQIADWIVKEIFHVTPVMEGHEQAQQRASSPALGFLRSIALTVEQANQLGCEINAGDIWLMSQAGHFSVPGLPEGADEKKAKMVIGSVMGKVFCHSDCVDIEDYSIRRQERQVERTDGTGGKFTSKTYVVTKATTAAAPAAVTP